MCLCNFVKILNLVASDGTAGLREMSRAVDLHALLSPDATSHGNPA